jgi:molybdopterin-containing oxidoreductase family iron-sulfur binding subunit
VGIRFCGNNCPYGVRKFNWFTYEMEKPLTEQLNPDITVRSVGVMEKCTFCMQRIRRAKDTAKDAKRPVKDGEIAPACGQTCPTNAITFGNINDPESQVAILANSKRRFRLLEEHGLETSVIYLKGGA